MPQPATPLRLLATCVLFATPLTGPAFAQAERPVLTAAPGCEGSVTDAYTTGYLNGVEAVKAQLAQATAQVQAQVQTQLNAQLAQMQAQSTAELDTRIAAAQDRALSDQATVGEGARMPSLARTTQALAAASGPKPAAEPATEVTDPATLPPGTTITIRDPQAMPPELYQALMAYAAN